jgi:hypothetical protein
MGGKAIANSKRQIQDGGGKEADRKFKMADSRWRREGGDRKFKMADSRWDI